MRHDLLHRSKYLRPRSIVGGAGKFSHIDLVQQIVMDYIFQLEIDSKVQSVQVTTGINNGSQVEILPDPTTGQTPLQVGQEVAVSALDVLSDGTPVVATRQG